MSLNMPKVREDHNMPRIFAEARKLSSGQFALPGQPEDQRYIAIITPERHTASVQAPLPEKMTPKMLQEVGEVVPETESQTITVIADTRIPEHGRLPLKTVLARMPFLGYLLGFAFVGHTVVVFEGHPSAIEAGCTGADLLIVDEEMMDALQSDWLTVAANLMRRPKVLVVTRQGSFLEVDVPKRSEEQHAKAVELANAPIPEEEEEEEELDFDFLNDEEEDGKK
jgi:hypothetical protein